MNLKSDIITTNGVSTIIKGCRLTTACNSINTGNSNTGQTLTCCTGSGCNTQTCPVVTTTPTPSISCYTVHCANCAANTLGTLTACPVGAYSCYVIFILKIINKLKFKRLYFLIKV